MSSMKRSIASSVIVVLLVLSLEATFADAVRVIPDAPAGGAIVRLPSDGERGVTTSAAAADDKKQLRWLSTQSASLSPTSASAPTPAPTGRRRRARGAKDELVHDSLVVPPRAPAPPCEHPFCIFIRGEPVCRCLDGTRPAPSSSVEMRMMMHADMERASS
uniref:Uncharacterized protein n=1 Tax=Zea mays TaxID=4577 RepID=B6U9X4_MAIZE|nr:hypothetical protein [Zea mays]